MKRAVVLFIVLSFFSVPAIAKKKVAKGPEENKTMEMSTFHDNAAHVFSAHDKITIQTYYRHQASQERMQGEAGKGKGKQKTLPPGLQKKLHRGGSLPPGWQRKLNRGDVMDHEAYQYARPIPQVLAESLPEEPEGTELVRVEDRIFRVIKATRKILDVLDIRF